MSELKKYVEKINELIKKYRKELHGSVRDDKVLHLETIKFRLENEINNTKSYEEGTIFRKAMEQSIEERYKHETDNAESYINHVVNPANDVETLLAETALVDIKPVMTSSQGVSTADAVYVSDSNVVSYSKIAPGETEVANAIGRILNDDSEKGIGNPDIMAIIIRGLSKGDSAAAAGAGAANNDDKISHGFEQEMKYDSKAVANQDKKRAKFIKCLNSGIQGNRINFVELTIKATAFAATKTIVKEFLIRCICGEEASKIMGSIVKHVVNDTNVCDAIIARLDTHPGMRDDLAERRTEPATNVFIAECLTKDIGGIGHIVTAINSKTNVKGLAEDLSTAFKYIIDQKKSGTFASTAHINDARFKKILAASMCADADLSDIVREINKGGGAASAVNISEIADDKDFPTIIEHINNNTAAVAAGIVDDEAAKMFFKNRTRGKEYEKALAAALCIPTTKGPIISNANIGSVFQNHGGGAVLDVGKIVQNDKHIKKIISHINSNGDANDTAAVEKFVNASFAHGSYELLLVSSLCCDDIFERVASEIFSLPTKYPNHGSAATQGLAEVANNDAFTVFMKHVNGNDEARKKFIANAKKNKEYERLAAAAVCIAEDLNEILRSISSSIDDTIPFLRLIEKNDGHDVKIVNANVKAAQMLLANINRDDIYKAWILLAICLTGTNKCSNIADTLVGGDTVNVLANKVYFIYMMDAINKEKILREDFVKNVASGGKTYELLASAALCANADYSNLINSIVADFKTLEDATTNTIVLKIIPHININDDIKGSVPDNAAALLFVANHVQSKDYEKLIAAALCINNNYSRIAEVLNTIGVATNVADAAGKDEFKAVLNQIAEDDKAAAALIKNVDKAEYQRTIATALCASNTYTNITDAFCGAHTVATLAGVAEFVEVMKHINNNTGAANDAAAKLFLANVERNTYANLYAAALCADTGGTMATVLYGTKNVAETAANAGFLLVMSAIDGNVNSKGNVDLSAMKNDANKLLVARMVPVVAPVLVAAPPAAPAPAPAAAVAGEIQRLLASALCVKDTLDGIADVICDGIAVSTLSADVNFAEIMTHINNNTGAVAADTVAADLFLQNHSGQSKANIYAAALCITGDYKNMADALFTKHGSISALASDANIFMPVMNALNGNFINGTASVNAAAVAAAAAFTTLARANDAKYDAHRTVLAAALCADNNFSNVVGEFLGNVAATAANVKANAVIDYVNKEDKAVAAFCMVLNKPMPPSVYMNLASLMLCAEGNYSTLIEEIGRSLHLPVIADFINKTGGLSNLLMAGHTRSDKYRSLIANILCIDADLNEIAKSITSDYKTIAAAALNNNIVQIATNVDNHKEFGNFMKNLDKDGYSSALAVFLCANVVLTNIPAYLINLGNGDGISGIANKKEFVDVVKRIDDNTGAITSYFTPIPPGASPNALGTGIFQEEAALFFINSVKINDAKYKKLYAAALCSQITLKNIPKAFLSVTKIISNLAVDTNFIDIIQFIEKNEDIDDKTKETKSAENYTKTFSLEIWSTVLCINNIPNIKKEIAGIVKDLPTILASKHFLPLIEKINYNIDIWDAKSSSQNSAAATLFINCNKDMSQAENVLFLLSSMLFETYNISGTYEGALATNIWHLVCNDGPLLTEVMKKMEIENATATPILKKILAHKDTDLFSKSDKDSFLQEANKKDVSGSSQEYPHLNAALTGVTTTVSGGGYSLMNYPERLGGILALGGAFLNIKSLVFVAIVLLIMLILFVIFDSSTQPNKLDRHSLTYFPSC